MKDRVKTKEQLIVELVKMRRRIAGLEAAETEQVRAEKTLRETSDYLEKLFDYANAPIIVWDTEFKITRFNHAFERLSGYMAGQVIGQELRVLFPDTSRDESLNKIERTSSGEYWESVEIPILRQDGDIRLALWNSANIHAEDGMTVIATIAQGTDITERGRAEEALRETSDYLEKLFDYANAPIIVWDTEFKITRFNHAFERLSGYMADQVIGQELHLLFPDTSRDESLNKIERTSSGEYWESVEIPILRQDGDIRLVLWNSANIHVEDGTTVIATIAQGTDITKRVRAEESLRQYTAELEARNKELDAFAHTVAHDLKNPLSLVIGFAEGLDEHHTALFDDKLRGYLRSIAENSRKMSNIIDALLLLASVRGIEKVEIKSLDMASIVAEAQRCLVRLIEEHEAKIVVPPAGAWPVTLGYGPWVEEVWANYINNAIKHGGQPPRVELGFSIGDCSSPGEESAIPNPQSEMVCFWVRDNGAGLTPEEQGRLFRPFERLDPKSDKGRVKGHGLGLSIVLRIVKKLGGEVGVESKVGQGSAFWFTLPAHQSRRTTKPPWS